MGKRRPAPRHRAQRRWAFAAPGAAGPLLTLVAVLAVSLTGGGAATTSASAGSSTASGTGVHDLTGTDEVGWTHTGARLDDRRERRVSRDSDRQALQDAAGSKLGQVAGDQARESNAALKSLGRAAEAKAGQIPKNAWHLPTRGYHLTARFGQAGGHWVSNHTGLDFAAPTGTPIYAVAPGQITETGWAGAYGNRTVETLPDGTELWYCHQSAIGVKVGQQVLSGQTIGAVGATGNTTGPHVHLEVRPGGGDPVDPYQALLVHGVKP